MKYRVDRIEEGFAVCFDDKDNIFVVAPDKLPDGVRDGTLLEITPDADGGIAKVAVTEPEESESNRSESMKSRLDALLKRNSNDN